MRPERCQAVAGAWKEKGELGIERSLEIKGLDRGSERGGERVEREKGRKGGAKDC